MERTLTVRRSKTEAGERVIPLNADAMAAILELRECAKAFGGTEPDHYVFPACKDGKVNPTRSQQTFLTAWHSLTREAGLRGLRFHDLRHHAITELAESVTSDQTIMSVAGHVSPRMLAHYSHVRLEAKRKALDALSSRGSGGSYGTNDATPSQTETTTLPQLIETTVRPLAPPPGTSNLPNSPFAGTE